MRRILALVSLFALLVLGFASLASSSFAQDSTPQPGILPEPVHPLIGTWIVTDPDGAPALTSFTSDGTVTDVEADGTTGLGTWQPTGERTAIFTMILIISGDEFNASIQLNVEVSIDASGNSGTADYTYTAVLADGTVIDSGRGQGTISRLMAQPLEAMGTPIASFPTWNPSAEEGTPVASPTS